MPGQGYLRLPTGSARTWLQQRYYSERCRNHPPPRGGVSRESSRISWKMSRSDGPKALPLEGRGTPGASRRDFLTHAGSLGPHRAHTEHRACGPGSPRQRAPPPRPLSPPRREGAPRLPPQAWGTLRQRGGSEPLARTTWSASFQPGHTTGAVPDPAPNPDYHHQVLRGNKAETVGTPGISEAAASSWENPCGTTSDDFRSSALSCPTSPTQMSSARSSPAPLAATW
jgi:hypothetical protein